jgi:NitT/TauT family transport system ATP-binding protein
MTVTMRDVSHAYGPKPVLDAITLAVRGGEVVAVLGRSGAGKTTLLQIAAGLLRPASGEAVCGGPVAAVFQEPRLLPWRRVLDNAAFGLKCRGVARAERRARARRMLRRLQLADAADLWPAELSGGMRQRVALARAFLIEPKVLLLDEPFAALDVGLRRELLAILRTEIAADCAVLMITHDVVEAATVADRIVVLDGAPARIVVDHVLHGGPRLRPLPAAHRIAANLFADRRVAQAFGVNGEISPANVIALEARR